MQNVIGFRPLKSLLFLKIYWKKFLYEPEQSAECNLSLQTTDTDRRARATLTLYKPLQEDDVTISCNLKAPCITFQGDRLA